MNILFLNPPFLLTQDSPYSKTGAILPALGILYVASYLRKYHPEHKIQVFDGPAYKLTIESFKDKLNEYNPDVVGITIYTTTFPVVMETIKIAREKFPKALIVAGGPHASIFPEECINLANADIVVLGEGEKTFTSLIEHIEAKKDISGVLNIVYRKNGQVNHTERKMEIIDLNAIPFPARDLLEIHRYRPAKGTYKRLPALNMITSRGCPYQCCYCSKNVFGSKYRAQSPSRTIEEIELLIKNYGIKEIYFNDDVFTQNMKKTEELCDLLIERKIDLTWGCSTRFNLVTPKLLEKMKKSGCITIGYGIESGDPEMLKIISKDISLDHAKEVIKWTKKIGIESRSFYIFGFPGETKESMNRTFQTALDLDTDFVMFNLAIPIPGTEMYNQADAENSLIYKGLELYKRSDGPHYLIKLKDISENELRQFYKDAYKKYYLRPHYILKRILNIRSFDDLKRNISGLLSFISWLK
ncbi:MAG: B12-binding domain-containing radical SAM protein [Elusimicrobia bacterium]|nr:B12-binding domain-containing radical SAM protein [Elusimicrobiota bacterium]